MFEIVLYRKGNGEEPVRKHLEELPLKLRVKVLRNMTILREMGNELRYPETDSLGDGLFELRTICGGNLQRMLFFFDGPRRIVVTHGFVKKTQRTPPREIRRARLYRQNYYEQNREQSHDNA